MLTPVKRQNSTQVDVLRRHHTNHLRRYQAPPEDAIIGIHQPGTTSRYHQAHAPGATASASTTTRWVRCHIRQPLLRLRCGAVSTAVPTLQTAPVSGEPTATLGNSYSIVTSIARQAIVRQSLLHRQRLRQRQATHCHSGSSYFIAICITSTSPEPNKPLPSQAVPTSSPTPGKSAATSACSCFICSASQVVSYSDRSQVFIKYLCHEYRQALLLAVKRKVERSDHRLRI